MQKVTFVKLYYNEHSDSGFDWQQIIEDSSVESEKRWVGLVEIKKNLYIEDDDVGEMKPKQVELWR